MWRSEMKMLQLSGQSSNENLLAVCLNMVLAEGFLWCFCVVFWIVLLEFALLCFFLLCFFRDLLCFAFLCFVLFNMHNSTSIQYVVGRSFLMWLFCLALLCFVRICFALLCPALLCFTLLVCDLLCLALFFVVILFYFVSFIIVALKKAKTKPWSHTRQYNIHNSTTVMTLNDKCVFKYTAGRSFAGILFLFCFVYFLYVFFFSVFVLCFINFFIIINKNKMLFKLR